MLNCVAVLMWMRHAEVAGKSCCFVAVVVVVVAAAAAVDEQRKLLKVWNIDTAN